MTNTKKNIFYLTGIKHSGKSNVGLSATIQMKVKNFVDVDNLIVNMLPYPYLTIRSFYETEGKEAFIELEERALSNFLENIVDEQVYIIALGGGACDNALLVNLMKETGTIIYLSVKEATLFERIKQSGIPPFLDKNNMEESFHALYMKRDEQYRKISDFVVSLADFESIESNGTRLASFISRILGDTTWVETLLGHH